MAYDQSTSIALQNMGILNKQFADAFSPFNNYAAQNLQLGIQQQRLEQDRAQRIHEMQLAQQFAKEREAAQYDYNRRLAAQAEDATFRREKQAEESAYKRGVDLANLGHSFSVSDQIKAQADKIRTDQTARRVIGKDIATFKDSPEGNAALVASYTQALSDPKVSEKLDTEDAIAITSQIKDALGRLTSTTAGSPQAKAAVLQFLATPGVVNTLLKEGDLTTADIQQIQQGGDPAKVYKAIQSAADSAWTSYGERSTLNQLLPAWNTALQASGAVQSPDQIVNADFLKTLLTRRDAILQKGTINSPDSWTQIAKAAGFAKPETPKMPPPTIGTPAGSVAPLRVPVQVPRQQGINAALPSISLWGAPLMMQDNFSPMSPAPYNPMSPVSVSPLSRAPVMPPSLAPNPFFGGYTEQRPVYTGF